MKKNFFGSVELTPGENLANAVRGKDATIGIPEWKILEAIEILRKALEDDEYTVAIKGFGLGCPRLLQKEIAEEIGVEPYRISSMAGKIVEKLRYAPYKSKLLALVPSNATIYEALHKKELNESETTRLRGANEALNRRVNGMDRQIDALKKANDALKVENDELKSRLSGQESAEQALTSTKKELADSQATVARLVEAISAIYTIAGNSLPDYIAKAESVVAPVSSRLFSKTLDQILGSSMAKRLSAVRINTLAELVQMTKRSLIALKFRGEEVDEIQRRLKEINLSLRVG